MHWTQNVCHVSLNKLHTNWHWMDERKKGRENECACACEWKRMKKKIRRKRNINPFQIHNYRQHIRYSLTMNQQRWLVETNIKLIILSVRYGDPYQCYICRPSETGGWNSKITRTATDSRRENIYLYVYYPLTLLSLSLSHSLLLCVLRSSPPPAWKSVQYALTHCTWTNRCYYNKWLQNISW